MSEVRSLTQQLAQNLLPIYQPECRVDLGSDKCGIPILPPIIERQKIVALGEFYRVPTGTADVTIEGLVDGGFEVDSPGQYNSGTPLTHWTHVTGTVDLETNDNGLNPDTGNQMINASNTASNTEIRQDIDLVALGYAAADIDAGDCSVSSTSRRANSAPSDLGQIIIEALDGTLTLVSTLYDTTMEEITPEDTWVTRALSLTTIPSTTRYIRYRWKTQWAAGSGTNSNLDTASVKITGPFTGMFSDSLTNGGAESDAVGTYNAGTPPTGWTVDSNSIDIVGTTSGLAPKEGSKMFIGTTGVDTAEMHQDISLATEGFSATAVDEIGVHAAFSMYRANASTNADKGRIRVEFLDASGTIISTGLDTGLEAITPQDTWTLRAMSQTRLPRLTRTIRVRIDYDRFLGSGQSLAAFDAGVLTLTNEFQTGFENRVYEVTTAGITAATLPTYDTTISNTTADGTAVLTARDAFMRSAVVVSVTDRRKFTISVDEARAVDSWFKSGAAEFQSGSNTGKVVEIREWTQSTALVELFLPVPFVIQVGDGLRLYAGCQKRLDEDCVTKFANHINYRGEPFVPGTKHLLRGPEV